MATLPHEDVDLARDKTEENHKDWESYWMTAQTNKNEGFMNFHGSNIDWKDDANGEGDVKAKTSANNSTSAGTSRRWIFAMRHGERVDVTYGQWTPHCFDKDGNYVRKDLNLPLTLAERAGGVESYARDSPLTRVGRFQAELVGEGLRVADVTVTHVYASAALRCVETAHHFLLGLKAPPSVKVRVEPALFEYKMWHSAKGLAPFMTPRELHAAGYNVDLDYKPYMEFDVDTPETMDDFYERCEKVIQHATVKHEAEGGNIIFVGHAATLEILVHAVKRLDPERTDFPPYTVTKNLLRVPYCALGAMRDKPFEVVCPPCPPSINSSSGRFDWKMLLESWQ